MLVGDEKCRLYEDDTEAVKVEDFRLDNGTLAMYFNAAYTQLETYTEVMVRAAVVKTLLQIPGVDSITFYVAEIPFRTAPVSWWAPWTATVSSTISGRRASLFDHDFDALLRERGRAVSDPGNSGRCTTAATRLWSGWLWNI